MDILFIVPYAPTLIRTRPLSLLRGLGRRGHGITLATVWESGREYAALEQLSHQGVRVLSARLGKPRALRNALSAIASGKPMQAAYAWQPVLMTRILQALARQTFDVVHVEHLRGAEYGRSVLAQLLGQGVRTPVIWDSVDCISHLFEQAARHSRSRASRWMTRFELPRTQRYEAWAIGQFDGVVVTAPADKAALEALPARAGTARVYNQRPMAQRPIFVLPNGVDTDYFSPSSEVAEPRSVVFTGKMSYHANVTAALHLAGDIMPHVWRQLPNTQLVIAGQAPPREIRALAERQPSRIAVTDFVADMRPYLRSAAVAVAPIAYGAGIQNKVLEAMACGVPVVASSQASAALQARPERELLIANTPSDFAEAVIRLLEDRSLRTQVGAAGRAYVEAHHQWDTVTARLEAIYDACRQRQQTFEPMPTGGWK